ncbi:MAG: hypothetical protein HQK75_00875 [Candidatus Magnetomorum sp.]|nr:hypothetical protein [Candidatus Magnetomorum sp.]
MKNDDIVLNIEREMLDVYEAEKNMIQHLEKADKVYIPIKDIVRKIPQELRNRLEIKVTAPVKKLRQQMERLMGQRLKIFPGKRATYIGKNLLSEELVTLLIKNHPDISLGLLCQKLPLPKKQSIIAINTLIDIGVLSPRINEKMTVFFSIKDTKKAEPEMIRQLLEDQSQDQSLDSEEHLQEEFHKAYQTVGKGRNFVRIHRIRDSLNWSKEKFDRVLTSLMTAYAVELHGGDPSSMTEKEISDSFNDENGRLFLTISWRN